MHWSVTSIPPSFNSRPHKEVDDFLRFLRYVIGLSIHDLTRRSTQIPIQIVDKAILSIHDLTRRSTAETVMTVKYHLPFNSRPHKEVDISK